MYSILLERKKKHYMNTFCHVVKSFHYTHISKHWEPQTPHPAHMRLSMRSLSKARSWWPLETEGSAFSAKRFMSSSITTKPEVRPILAGENSRIGKLQDGPRSIAFSCRTFLWLNSMFMVDITIVNGVIMVYKPTYNWGGPSCNIAMDKSPSLIGKSAVNGPCSIAMLNTKWYPIQVDEHQYIHWIG